MIAKTDNFVNKVRGNVFLSLANYGKIHLEQQLPWFPISYVSLLRNALQQLLFFNKFISSYFNDSQLRKHKI